MNHMLQSDCENCFGLCCVALPYAQSADFASNKEVGVPCPNLQDNNRCSIHEQLRDKGYQGCVTYECFGAGQHVSHQIFNGKDWRKNPKLAKEMYAVFPIVQQLHEMLYYLNQALQLEETQAIHNELHPIFDKILSLTNLNPNEILQIDVPASREKVNDILLKSSELVRKDYGQRNKKSMLQKECLGANLKGADLRGMNLRGALMIASDLSNADLRKVDFIGADLRDADLSGANLIESIFLTQAQVNSAKGNQHTRLPRYLKAPDHWLNP